MVKMIIEINYPQDEIITLEVMKPRKYWQELSEAHGKTSQFVREQCFVKLCGVGDAICVPGEGTVSKTF
jgi:hypothetical protein